VQEVFYGEKVIVGLVMFGVVIIGILRLGMGTAAVAGLGHIPMSMIPTRLRCFLFGERSGGARKLSH
jgi:hypothetical protein